MFQAESTTFQDTQYQYFEMKIFIRTWVDHNILNVSNKIGSSKWLTGIFTICFPRYVYYLEQNVPEGELVWVFSWNEWKKTMTGKISALPKVQVGVTAQKRTVGFANYFDKGVRFSF